MTNSIPENVKTLLSTYNFALVPDSTNDDLNCTLCKKLLLDAFQTLCDCKYCRKCIVSYINDGNEYCPGGKEECREELLVLDGNVCRSGMLNKKILRIKVCCPNESCLFTSSLTLMEDHLRVCSHQSMECPYTKIGCANSRLNRDTVETHLNGDKFAHSQMLMEVVDYLKNEVGANKLEIAFLREEYKLKERELREEKRKGQEVEELKREVAALRGQMECGEYGAQRRDRLTDLEEQMRELRGEIATERKLKEEVEPMKKEIRTEKEETKKLWGKRSVSVDFPNTLPKRGVAVGEIWFTVDGISDLMKKGEAIDSPHLLSHVKGYKLRIRVETSFGYLYVYSVICKGKYDDVLSWPASGLSVSVSLVNQGSKEAYKTVTIKYNSQHCNQPVDIDNPPYGCLLIHNSDLLSSTGLIVLDSILLHATATPP